MRKLKIYILVPILVFATLLPNPGYTSQDISSGLLLGSQSNGTNCMGEDFIECYNQILEYVERGDAAIRISNVTDAVIVIGNTRVGKSTLTQFVANVSNPLTVKCEFTSCFLIDDSGDGGNDVISKTFVPNTVINNVTNGIITPFYDMPGFDDTRSMAVEIANSFFIQKVIRNIKQVKIVVVGKHAGFSGTETTFKNLMDSLIKFTKTPEKFKDSVFLLSNFGNSEFDDFDHFGEITQYLESYKKALDGPTPPNDDKETAKRWIDVFLTAPPEDQFNLQQVAIFMSPKKAMNGKSIRDIESYQTSHQKMKTLLWDNLRFTPVTPADIGFSISTEAELFLETATTESSNTIRKSLQEFVRRIQQHMTTLLQTIPNDFDEDGFDKFISHFLIFKHLEFENCKNIPEASPEDCILGIQNELSSIAEEMDDGVFQEIEKVVNFLQFCFADVGKEKKYDMKEWVTGFFGIAGGLEPEIRATTQNINKNISTHFEGLSTEVRTYFNNQFTKITPSSPSDVLEQFNRTITEILSMDKIGLCIFTKSIYSPGECFEEVVTRMAQLINATQSPILSDIEQPVKFLNLIHQNLSISEDPSEWVKDLANLRTQITSENENGATRIYTMILSEVSEISHNASVKISAKIPSEDKIQEAVTTLQMYETLLTETNAKLRNYTEASPLSGYLDLIANEYSEYPDEVADPTSIRMDIVDIIERLKIFHWGNSDWKAFHEKRLLKLVKAELITIRFLSALYDELEQATFQAGEQGRLHSWRYINRVINKDNVDSFWLKFSEAKVNSVKYSKDEAIIKEHVSTKRYIQDWLNALLDHTLNREETCPPNNFPEKGLMVFERRYLSMEHVKECVNRESVKPTKVILLAQESIFFNAVIKIGSNTGNETKLFVLSQTFDTSLQSSNYIDISGNDGAEPNPFKQGGRTGAAGHPGAVGQNGGDFIGIFNNLRGTNIVSYGCGGTGGRGQGGGNGIDGVGTNNPGLEFDGDRVRLDYCAAWKGGKIQVRTYPNSCNSEGDNSKCDAGDNGKWVAVWGTAPTPPESGGPGGVGGASGIGGRLVLLDVSTNVMNIKKYDNGTKGENGLKGERGREGVRGASCWRFDDKYCASCVEQRCYLKESGSIDNQCRNESPRSLLVAGPNIADSNPTSQHFAVIKRNAKAAACTTKSVNEKYPLSEYTFYVSRLQFSATKDINVFNRIEMTKFLIDIDRSNYLQ